MVIMSIKTCPQYTIKDVIDSKKNDINILKKDKNKLHLLNCDKIKNVSFAGNKIIYNYFFEELLNTKKSNGKNFYSIFNNENDKERLIEQAVKRDRRKKQIIIHPEDLFECWRINSGSITFFKPSVMKQLVTNYMKEQDDNKDIKILDLTMGWGGRLIGALASQASNKITYVGYDTNVNLKKPYIDLLKELYNLDYSIINDNVIHFENNIYDITLHFEDFINIGDTDFNDEFDLVISSPPYNNLEVYSHMETFHNKNAYYDWLITYTSYSIMYAKTDGLVGLSLSKEIYDELVKRRPDLECSYIELMGQQMGKSRKKDYIYVWKNNMEK